MLHHIYELGLNNPTDIKIYSDGQLYYNNIYVSKSSATGNDINTPLYLFKRANNSSYAYAQIGEVIITNNGIEKLHYIPALDSLDVPCMYDLVTKRIFYNAGNTENFVAGSKVYPSMGNQNIDGKYEIPLKIQTINGESFVTITLNSPLRKVNDTADYIDIKNKKVIRYIGEDCTILDTPIEETFKNDDLPNIEYILSISVETDVPPSKIEKYE